MFRLFKAELKKIFLKPSIFVVTGLIITMLALSFFVFKPVDKTNYLDKYVNWEGSGAQTFDNWYTSSYYNQPTTTFEHDDEVYYLENRDAINYLNDADDLMYFYENYDTDNDGLYKLKNLWKNIETSFNEYYEMYSSSKDNINERDALFSKIDSFSTEYNKMISSKTKIYILVKSSTDDGISDSIYKLSEIKSRIAAISSTPGTRDAFVINEIRDTGIMSSKSGNGIMKNLLNQITQFKPNKNEIATLRTYVSTAVTRLMVQKEQIHSYYTETKDQSPKSQQIQHLRKLIADYKLTAKYAFDIINDGSLINGIPSEIETNLTSYVNFSNQNFYQLKIEYNQTKYLFDNELYEYNYATPYSLSQPSNDTINGMDYSYFALRLCSVFITVYLVVLAAGTIAGEQSAGTLKLLAIRPFSRSKLLFGKSLAIFAIGGILLAVSSVASLVIGGVTYGLSSASIMTVFNGTQTLIISPLILYIIAFLTMYIEIMFYASLSIFISTAFKSNVGAVSISTLAFFVSLILNGVLTGLPAVGFLPFTNISFFKYYGSAFVANTNSFITMILSPGVFVGATFWSSLVIYLLTVGVLIYIPHLIFKNRDLK